MATEDEGNDALQYTVLCHNQYLVKTAVSKTYIMEKTISSVGLIVYRLLLRNLIIKATNIPQPEEFRQDSSNKAINDYAH